MRAKLEWSKLISAPQGSYDMVHAEDVELFLRHLDFPNHYRCPPFLPPDDVDLQSPPPFSSTYSTVVDDDHIARLMRLSEGSPQLSNPAVSLKHTPSTDGRPLSFAQSPALVYLAFYFEASDLLQLCEQVLCSLPFKYAQAWLYLGVAVEYKWAELQRECMDAILNDDGMLIHQTVQAGESQRCEAGDADTGAMP